VDVLFVALQCWTKLGQKVKVWPDRSRPHDDQASTSSAYCKKAQLA